MEGDNSSRKSARPLVQDGAPKAATPEVVRFAVFRDRQGNRFVFPSVYSARDRSISWEFCRQTCLALSVEEEKERLTVTADADGYISFPHVKASAGSSGFAHGSSDVWLVSGPVFDAIANAMAPVDDAGKQVFSGNPEKEQSPLSPTPAPVEEGAEQPKG